MPRAPVPGSVCAYATATSQSEALVIQAFSPSSRQPPGTREARVVMAPKSEPTPGSVSAVQPIARPADRSGTQRAATSGRASRARRAAMFWVLIIENANAKSAAASSSVTRALAENGRSSPPCSRGTWIRARPIAAPASIASRPMRRSRSQRAADGATTSRAKSAVRRNRASARAPASASTSADRAAMGAFMRPMVRGRRGARRRAFRSAAGGRYAAG